MDDFDGGDGEPTRFIRELRDDANILTVYENEDYAKSLEFLFLKTGLRDGRTCLYLSSEDVQKIEKRMSLFGIDPDAFKDDRRLQIVNTCGRARETTADTIREFVESAVKSDVQAMITIRNSEFSEEQYHDLMLLESTMMTLFGRGKVSILSSYNAEFLSDATMMQRIINMHDYVIFAPTFGKGLVVKTR